MPHPNERGHGQPPVWLQVAVLVTLFLGGGVAGVALAERLAPDSIVASFAGLFAFPTAFAVGLQLWLGAALVATVWKLARRRRLEPRAQGVIEIPGAFVFVPVAMAVNSAAGLIVAIAGSSIGVVMTLGLYLALGTAYGVACWRLARGGYLPLPE